MRSHEHISGFTFVAQVQGHQQRLEVTSVAGGYRINSEAYHDGVRTLSDAIDSARKIMGLFLRHGERDGRGWGLYLSVDGVSVVYGESPVPLGPPSPPTGRLDDIGKIYRRWRLEDGPRAALANALNIIEFVARSSRAAA